MPAIGALAIINARGMTTPHKASSSRFSLQITDPQRTIPQPRFHFRPRKAAFLGML